MNFTPLHVLAQETATLAAVRIRGRNKVRWDGIGHTTNGHLRQSGGDDYPEWDKQLITYQWEGLPEVDWESFEDGDPEIEEGIVCYTDGSQIDEGPVGFGFVARLPEVVEGSGSLGLGRTVFQGEVFAVQRAASMMEDMEAKGPKHFYIDSQSAIRALNKIECESKTVENCRSVLTKLGKRGKITLHWVKAHVGHSLNERADVLAKAGTEEVVLEEVPFPPATIRQQVQDKGRRRWEKEWRGHPSCRQTKLFMPEPQPDMARAIFGMDRQDISAIIQFITGHNYLKYHLYNTNRAGDKICRKCQEAVETAWHLVAECLAMYEERLEIFHARHVEGLPKPKQVIRFAQSFTVERLMEQKESLWEEPQDPQD